VNYSNASLSGFCAGIGQFQDLYTYPRFIGNDGYDHYLPYLTYDKQFYPSHTAHELPYSIFNDETFVMGSSTYDIFTGTPPEKIVLTRTDNYAVNNCYTDYIPLTADHIETTQTPVTPGDLGSDVVDLPELYYDIDFSVYLNDCNNDNLFKEPNHLTTYDFNYLNDIMIDKENLIIKSKMVNGSYKLYNSLGQLLLQGKMDSGYACKNVSNLPVGIYLVEIVSEQNKRVGTKKLNKD
jgi:hypothetical protein